MTGKELEPTDPVDVEVIERADEHGPTKRRRTVTVHLEVATSDGPLPDGLAVQVAAALARQIAADGEHD